MGIISWPRCVTLAGLPSISPLDQQAIAILLTHKTDDGLMSQRCRVNISLATASSQHLLFIPYFSRGVPGLTPLSQGQWKHSKSTSVIYAPSSTSYETKLYHTAPRELIVEGVLEVALRTVSRRS